MPKSNLRVLVVDDEENQRSALARMLQSWGHTPATAANGQEALERLQEFDAEVIVTDLMMPVMDGAELLRRLKEQPGAPPAIMLTGFGNVETAINVVLDLGAFWFLEKPLQPAALRLLIERAVAQRNLAKYNERLEIQLSQQGVLGELVGASPLMQEVYSLLRQVAPTAATVLVTGESGTGKELAARTIHNLSPRRDGPFVAINCAAMPDTLIESELFGHERGAFTGAVERRRGCFENANGGTLLLDEIGEMPPGTQAKLLRVLEDRRVRRLGAQREAEVDVRVVASTNRNLAERVRQNAFREDLFFRLNVFEIALPPLRERLEDIALLSEAILQTLNARHHTKVSGIDEAALQILQSHRWPGNVRELRNALERAVIIAGEGTLHPVHFSGLMPSAPPPAPVPSRVDAVTLGVGTTVAQGERALIEMTLRHTNNNRTRAASILDISQKTLFNKLKEYGSAEA